MIDADTNLRSRKRGPINVDLQIVESVKANTHASQRVLFTLCADFDGSQWATEGYPG